MKVHLLQGLSWYSISFISCLPTWRKQTFLKSRCVHLWNIDVAALRAAAPAKFAPSLLSNRECPQCTGITSSLWFCLNVSRDRLCLSAAHRNYWYSHFVSTWAVVDFKGNMHWSTMRYTQITERVVISYCWLKFWFDILYTVVGYSLVAFSFFWLLKRGLVLIQGVTFKCESSFDVQLIANSLWGIALSDQCRARSSRLNE